LSARDYNDTTRDWQGSHLEAAGSQAHVSEWEESGIHGFGLWSYSTAIPGDWFIIDYTATGVGVCEVGFYDHSVSWDYPVYYHVFFQVPTRDFNNDAKVDFTDVAVFASYWGAISCSGPDWCEGTDLDADGDVDHDDLSLFADYWLERTQ
jgi:hypothetical protein